ncbi:MAG: SH3 domain-containing protein [Spirochaetota bacterium]
MKNKCKSLLLIPVLIFLAFLPACRKKETFQDVELPPTSVLSTQSSWAIIRASHLRLREKPSIQSSPITTFWRAKGFVLEVISKTARKETLEEKTDYWYQINYGGLTGWVFGGYLDIFDSREAAEKAAKELQ